MSSIRPRNKLQGLWWDLRIYVKQKTDRLLRTRRLRKSLEEEYGREPWYEKNGYIEIYRMIEDVNHYEQYYHSGELEPSDIWKIIEDRHKERVKKYEMPKM